MNKVYLNTVSLAKEPVINKGASAGGSGSGVIINNQEKSLEITENGVTEVTADAGFTGLSKVVVNTNVASSGGGGGSDMPVIGDGKTYLYITIAAEGKMNVDFYFSQTIANGVTIDWGDGSAPQTLSGTGNKSTSHKYAAIGDYVISLDPVDGCTLGLGNNNAQYCVMGTKTQAYNKPVLNMVRYIEIGRNIPTITAYAFQGLRSLASVVISDSVTSIGNNAFNGCLALASVAIPDSVTSIGEYAFNGCSSMRSIVLPNNIKVLSRSMLQSNESLASITLPNSVTEIGSYFLYYASALASIAIPKGIKVISSNAFYYCSAIVFYDFSTHEQVPTIASDSFPSPNSFPSKFIVPDALYDEWKAATNWSSYASQIIKKSDWDASQS